LVEAVRNLPGLPGLATSPAGGTFVVGGPDWLGLCAIATLPDRHVAPLDWMMDALRAWFAAAFEPLGVTVHTGKVEGAWCPGFSDVAAGGRKLAGLGFRVTRGMVVMRGVLPVAPISDDDLRLLRATHALVDLRIDAGTFTSLAEATGDSTWTVERAIAHLRTVAT
jgi:lipoate-protein ligase A